MEAAATLRAGALEVVAGFDTLADNLHAVSRDLSFFAMATFLPNATEVTLAAADGVARDYVESVAYVGIAAVFCYAGLAFLATFCVEMQRKELKCSSNLLLVNQYLGVMYLAIVAAVICFEMFIGFAVTSFCLSEPGSRTVATLDRWPGKTRESARALEHYIHCDSTPPFDGEFSMMTASADVINRSVTEYLRYRTRPPCNETLNRAFHSVLNESRRLHRLLGNLAEDGRCETVHAGYERVVEEKVCGDLVDDVYVLVLFNLGMLFLLWFVLMFSSFQRQAIHEEKLVKTKIAQGHSMPVNFNSMATISQATTVYFGDHTIPKSPTEHDLAHNAAKADDVHWTWNPDI